MPIRTQTDLQTHKMKEHEHTSFAENVKKVQVPYKLANIDCIFLDVLY